MDFTGIFFMERPGQKVENGTNAKALGRSDKAGYKPRSSKGQKVLLDHLEEVRRGNK